MATVAAMHGGGSGPATRGHKGRKVGQAGYSLKMLGRLGVIGLLVG
jgi:hypothetical protein